MRIFTPAAVVAVLLLAACGDDGDSALVDNVSSEQADGEEASGDAGGTSPQGDEDATTDDGGESPSDQPIEGAATDEVIATVTADVPRGINRDGRVPIRVDVVGLERNGDLVDLTVVMANEDDADDFVPYTTEWADDSFQLIDQEGQQVYLPAQDSGGACLCNTLSGNMVLEPGESTQLYARYGGVPEGVEAVDVQTAFHPPMPNVPISG